MNKERDIKIRSLQSLIAKAANQIDKEIDEGGSSDELVLAKSFLRDAQRIITMLHHGATCVNRPPATIQFMGNKPLEQYKKFGGYQGGDIITIDCEVKP